MIVATNFKTNKTRLETKKYINSLVEFMKLNKITKTRVFVFPPLTSLTNVNLLNNLSIGAQNAYPVSSGAFTGEVGLEQLEEFTISSILIGHSERRHILCENQKMIVDKFNFFKGKKYNIIYCVGELADVRRGGINAIKEHLMSQLDSISLDYDRLIIAYEPVWAIGTGISVNRGELEEVLDFLSSKTNAPLIYGGSVNSKNANSILESNKCCGVLVGSSSLNIETFKEIIFTAEGF